MTLAEQTAAATTSDLPRSTRMFQVARLLLPVLVAAGLLIPIWTVAYPPLLDYPNHLATAFVLAHIKDGAFHFSHYYNADWGPYPYLVMYWILLGLRWLVPFGAAGRLLLSLCAVSVPAATWFFLRRANPGQEGLALWSVLIAENLFFFLFGMINIQLSLALCLIVLGVWLDYLAKPRVRLWLFLLLLTTLLYFTHVMGFGVAGVVVTSYALLSRQRLTRLLLSWLMFVPGAVLFFRGHFLHGHSHAASSWILQFRGPLGKANGLFSVMVGAYPALDFLTVVVIGLSIMLALSANSEFSWNRPWLGVIGFLLVLYCIFPARYGPGFNADRTLLPFIFVLCLCTARVGHRMRQLAAIAVILFLVRAAALERKFVSEQPALARVAMSFSAIPRNGTVLPLVGLPSGSTQPEYHFWAYGVIQRGWFSPCLFHDRGVDPLQVRTPAYAPCGPAPRKATAIHWDRVSREYDYVWALDVPQFTAKLNEIGKLVFHSGDLQVYRIRTASADP